MKLCKDCKHFSPSSISAKCASSDACHVRLPGTDPQFDPVSGREDRQVHTPRTMRMEGGHCGPSAKLFEERYSILRRLLR